MSVKGAHQSLPMATLISRWHNEFGYLSCAKTLPCRERQNLLSEEEPGLHPFHYLIVLFKLVIEKREKKFWNSNTEKGRGLETLEVTSCLWKMVQWRNKRHTLNSVSGLWDKLGKIFPFFSLTQEDQGPGRRQRVSSWLEVWWCAGHASFYLGVGLVRQIWKLVHRSHTFCMHQSSLASLTDQPSRIRVARG